MTPSGKFMLTIFGAVVELERGYILQRQKEGIATAKQQGEYHGSKPLANPSEFGAAVTQWQADQITATEAI